MKVANVAKTPDSKVGGPKIRKPAPEIGGKNKNEEITARGVFLSTSPKSRKKTKKYVFARITNHAMYKGAEVVMAVWLTLAHANDMHVLSSKDFKIGYSFNLASPVVYMSARLYAVVFKRQWVHWMVDVIFMIIYSINYIVVFCYLLSEIQGFQALHDLFFVQQRTHLREGMVFCRMLIAFFLCILLVIDNISVIVLRDRNKEDQQKSANAWQKG